MSKKHIFSFALLIFIMRICGICYMHDCTVFALLLIGTTQQPYREDVLSEKVIIIIFLLHFIHEFMWRWKILKKVCLSRYGPIM